MNSTDNEPINEQKLQELVGSQAQELALFEQAAKAVKDETDTWRARETLLALGAIFVAGGNEFYFDFPGSSRRTAKLIGPKGDTKMTRQQKSARAKAKAARKARKAARR